MNITNLLARIEAIHDEAYLTRQPSELTGALSTTLRIARAIEVRARCTHPKVDESITTHGRREKVRTCITCNATLSREEI